MKWRPFTEVVSDVTSKFNKIKASAYKVAGQYKIIDQGKEAIAGYTDDKNLVNTELPPIIVFGDHTRVIKYEDGPIALGADGAKALKVNSRLANTLYVYYYLRSIKLKEAGYSRHFKFLKEIKIPIPERNGEPNFDDQIRIVHLLSKVEGLIAQRKQHLQQLDDLLKSVFLEMFGDPVWNQKGWDTLPFHKVGKFVSGGTPSKNKVDFWSGHFPWVSPKDMKASKIEDAEDHVSQSVFEETTLKRIPINHLLIVVRGMILAHSFPVAINTVEVAINQDMKAIKPIEELNVVYLQNCLNAQKRQILKLISTAGHGTKKFDSFAMRKLFVPIPPSLLQGQFVSIVEKADGIKSHYQQGLASLEQLYGALSQKAFKGELDLSRVPTLLEQESYVVPEQHEREHAKQVEQNLPENINATLANLNALNASAEGLRAIADVSRLATFDLVQQDALRAIAEKMASLRSPLQELKQIDAITKAMERAQAVLKPLNLEHIDALTKSVELAHTITASLPHIDTTWLEHHTEAVRKAAEPFESMRKAMERIVLATIELPDPMRLASEAARRLQSSIPDFSAWQQQSADLPGAELDDVEGGVKRRFTREDLDRIFAQSTGPLSFETLFNQLNELETVDLSGYETIKAIIFELLAEQRLSQEFDEKTKSLLLAAHNPEAAH